MLVTMDFIPVKTPNYCIAKNRCPLCRIKKALVYTKLTDTHITATQIEVIPMGMDGFYRPSQALSYTDTIGNLDAAERAAIERKKKSAINQKTAVEAIQKDPPQDEGFSQQDYPEQDESWKEEIKDLLHSHFNLELDPEGFYRFDYNAETDRFELLDTTSNIIILSLPPEDFLQVAQNMRKNAGVMTDRSA